MRRSVLFTRFENEKRHDLPILMNIFEDVKNVSFCPEFL
jgi:hypothetical protein